MGAFFTNVQGHVGAKEADSVRATVIETMREWVVHGPFVETGAPETPDRTVLVAPVGADPWLAIYDQATENQDESVLQESARMLSIAVDDAALTVLVHDSDILRLHLFRSAVHVDSYDSWPDYFGSVSEQERQQLLGHPERWAGLLTNDCTIEELRHAWDHNEHVAPEDLLLRLSPVLGLNAERVTIGFDYLVEDEEDLSGFARLTFRAES